MLLIEDWLKKAWSSHILQGLACFFCKGPDSNVLGFVDYRGSDETIQLSCHSAKASIDKTYRNGLGCVPVEFYLGVGPSLACGPQFADLRCHELLLCGY